MATENANPMRAAAPAAMIVALLLSGCAAPQSAAPQPDIRAQFLTPGDVCGTQRARIIDEHLQRQRLPVDGALTGAGIGVVAGALIGALASRDNPLQGALIGGAIGGAAGGLTGYAAGYMQMANNNRAQALALLDSDTENQAVAVRNLTASVDALRACRTEQVRTVEREFRARRINRDEARSRLDSVATAGQQDTALIQQAFGVVDQRNGEFVQAAAQLNNATAQSVQQSNIRQAVLLRETTAARVRIDDGARSLDNLIERTRRALVLRTDVRPALGRLMAAG